MSRRFLAIPVALALLTIASVASAALYTASLSLSEAKECPAPPSPSGATGYGNVILDTNANTVTYDIFYTGISGTFSGAHIHGLAGVCPGTAGVDVSLTANGAGRLTGVGSYLEADEAGYLAGNSYVNIHTSLNPSGQIRDQLIYSAGAVPVSGPATMLLLAGMLGAGGIWWLGRRRLA